MCKLINLCDKCRKGKYEIVDHIDTIKKANREFNIYVCLCSNCSHISFQEVNGGIELC